MQQQKAGEIKYQTRQKGHKREREEKQEQTMEAFNHVKKLDRSEMRHLFEEVFSTAPRLVESVIDKKSKNKAEQQQTIFNVAELVQSAIEDHAGRMELEIGKLMDAAERILQFTFRRGMFFNSLYHRPNPQDCSNMFVFSDLCEIASWEGGLDAITRCRDTMALADLRAVCSIVQQSLLRFLDAECATTAIHDITEALRLVIAIPDIANIESAVAVINAKWHVLHEHFSIMIEKRRYVPHFLDLGEAVVEGRLERMKEQTDKLRHVSTDVLLNGVAKACPTIERRFFHFTNLAEHGIPAFLLTLKGAMFGLPETTVPVYVYNVDKDDEQVYIPTVCQQIIKRMMQKDKP